MLRKDPQRCRSSEFPDADGCATGFFEREKAPMGLFVTLTPPTKEMAKEAAAAGVWSSPNWRDVPRIQIVTIEDLLTQIVPPVRIPMARRDTFKKAAREKTDSQPSLDL